MLKPKAIYCFATLLLVMSLAPSSSEVDVPPYLTQQGRLFDTDGGR